MVNKEVFEIPLSDLVEDSCLPNPVMYQYYKNLKDRKIIINDQIDSGVVETVMLPLLQMDNDGSGKPIEIVLNTVGGSLFDGQHFVILLTILKQKQPLLL